MSTRTILVAFLALLCGAAMAASVLQASRPKTNNTVSIETEDVVVAMANIERGRLLAAPAIAVQKWPKGSVPATAARKIEDTKDKVLISPVLNGGLILLPNLANEDAGILDIRVDQGKRAFTVMASKVPTNVAGFVLPGSVVDVLLNMRGGGRGDETGGGSTTTLLQAVKVLAVDQRLENETQERADAKLSSVTLEVTPDQANMLDLGQNMGTLSLSLRNPLDTTTVDTQVATVANLRFHGEPAPAEGDRPPSPETLAAFAAISTPRPPETRPCIVTWRGGQRSQVWLMENDR